MSTGSDMALPAEYLELLLALHVATMTQKLLHGVGFLHSDSDISLIFSVVTRGRCERVGERRGLNATEYVLPSLWQPSKKKGTLLNSRRKIRFIEGIHSSTSTNISTSGWQIPKGKGLTRDAITYICDMLRSSLLLPLVTTKPRSWTGEWGKEGPQEERGNETQGDQQNPAIKSGWDAASGLNQCSATAMGGGSRSDLGLLIEGNKPHVAEPGIL
ncbi:uncharacterized protein FOMMEDRAFT_154747 [Fomitiporia mediterranea MF3/22]|uniref:uncharacterized protein n=1 Tax=Fomitiporia mediterranea (strain MF3/22) TaxID=694068 RepID=UPI00044079F3|nr:uncharacterized protein FOMMEDRAFT_154747 [Fomitiporia mediterranea MF3/22]EJD03648.1 hypothetical protein FOMMEDRAFT_154747 [Fomitiporia mediterranea MF3/22]